jgi:hypothetical protein
MTWRCRVAPALATLCLAWCVGIGFVIWFTPTRYSGVNDGLVTTVERSFSEVSGSGALPLVIPVLVAALGTWGAWRGRRALLIGSAVLLVIFTVVSGFSVGRAYVPATGLQLLAAGVAAFLGNGRPSSAAA